MVKRTITIELAVTMTREVPRSWSADEIDFHFNQGSYCLANLISDLHKESEAAGEICVLCGRSRVTLLTREGTD